MLAWRLGLSAILIPSFFAICYFDNRIGRTAPLLLILCLFIAVRGAFECAGLLTVRAMKPRFPLTAVLSAACVLAGWSYAAGICDDVVASLGVVSAVFSGAVLLLFFVRAVSYTEPGTNMETLGSELIIVSYTGVLLAATAQLRWVAGAEAGYLVLGSVVLAAKGGDTMAYTTGRLFGKRKMAPRLSPGKTWAGFTGAVLGAAAASSAWLYFVTPRFDPAWPPVHPLLGALYGGILGLTGLIGDLCESLIKRDVEKKDAAALMPGFGGLLDLVDSILYAGPVALLLWWLLPLKSW